MGNKVTGAQPESLADIMHSTASRMNAQFESFRAFHHRTLRGDAREEVLRDFLVAHFPPSLRFTSGEIIDSKGNRSGQQDIIICDAAPSVSFCNSNGRDIIPAECAYGVIEVKSMLNKSALKKCFESMRRLKSLKRTALLIREEYSIAGQCFTPRPLSYFLFAYESMGLRTMSDHIRVHDLGQPPDNCIDSVYVLNQGALFNIDKPDPTVASQYAVAFPGCTRFTKDTKTGNTLLLMYSLLLRELIVSRLAPIDIATYVKDVRF